MKQRLFVKLVLVFIINIFLTSCVPNSPNDNPGLNPTPRPTPGAYSTAWTIMVYVDGDNDLDPYAIQNINSMELVGSTDKVKIVVQYDSYGYAGARRYFITKDYDQGNITSPIIEDIGEVNMGTGETLVDFIQFCVKNYPAQKYSLILWNHGGGFKKPGYLPKDICWDETSGDDALTIPEVEQALNRSGVYFDLLAMDACLMGMLEVAYEVRNHTEIFVASEDNVPGEGFNYHHFLENLVTSPNMGPDSLARAMIDSYISHYPFGTTLTLASVNSMQLSALANEVNNLAMTIMQDNRTSKEVYRNIITRETICFSDVDFIDLGDFALKLIGHPQILSSQVKYSAQQVLNQVSNSVLYSKNQGNNSYWTLNNAQGISIYLPIYTKYVEKYQNLQFAKNTNWDDLIRHLTIGGYR
ncbi:clostripain-related cysteine peptidase [Atribacter laminatus]|uniref:Clostripain n=1 Tax=Atribacter laminatus TaxID=2847778 RepID=A0A7T1F3Z8_ATRLM|nr:clostripain-related cysteine peptidase [Atribacter laminatus]QPM68911.1 Clostripain [Atribacter laminatus]